MLALSPVKSASGYTRPISVSPLGLGEDLELGDAEDAVGSSDTYGFGLSGLRTEGPAATARCGASSADSGVKIVNG